MIVLPIGLAMAFVTIRDLRQNGRPPVPSEFLAAGGVLLGCVAAARVNEDLGDVIAWGYLIAVALQAATKGQLTTKPKATATAGTGPTSTA